MKYYILFPVFALFTLFFFVNCEDKEREYPAPTIHLKIPEEGFERLLNDTIEIFPKVTYAADAKYEWWQNGQIIREENKITITESTSGIDTFRFVVVTPTGSDTIHDIIVQTIIKIDFEDQHLEMRNDSAWNGGKGELLFETNEGLARFPVNYQDIGKEWAGFAYSNKTNITTRGVENQFSAFSSKGGAEESTNYALFHQYYEDELAIEFTGGKNYSLKSMAINNSTYAYKAMKLGSDDDNAKIFGGSDRLDKDWFLLTIKGYNTEQELTGTVTYYLADYRSGDAFLLDRWETIGLSDLGAVNSIKFELTSSDTTAELMNTPAYFCFDNIKIIPF